MSLDRTRTGEGSANARQPTVDLIYGIATAAFVTLALWGSLFPFNFRRLPLADAAAMIWRVRRIDLVTWSLSDLVSNVLLFVPIGLFAAATVERTWPGRGGVPAAWLGVLAGGVVLSTALEFGQAFVPWRTPSVIDVLAEAMGTVAGVAIWRAAGDEFGALLRAAANWWRALGPVERLLLFYCAGFALMWLLPFDFTLRPAEIGDKYEHKRLLLPFTPSPDAATRAQLAFTVASAIPLGIGAALCGCGSGGRRSVARASLVAWLWLTWLELGQVLVFSRTTDGTLLLAAIAGATLGGAMARTAKRPAVRSIDFGTWRAALPAVLWLAVVVLFEWWPFDVLLDADHAWLATTAWSRAPFRFPAEPLDVFPGALLALVAGVALRARLSPPYVRLKALSVVAIAGAVFLFLESGRVLLVAGRPTLLSVLVKVAALAIGLWAASVRQERLLRDRELG